MLVPLDKMFVFKHLNCVIPPDYDLDGQGEKVSMHEQIDNKKNKDQRWYVMVHLKPSWIETMLHRESRGELMSREERETTSAPEPFEFFVPFLFMRPDVDSEVRSIFHHFVFIRASEERLHAILKSEWNRTSNIRLRHYRDGGGKEIMISDEEFQQLRATIMNRQLKVFFGMPVEHLGEMAVGDRVTLLIDDWRGKQGKIERIRLKKGRASMVVAVNILGQTKSVNFEDLHDGDVIFADNDTERLLTGNLISNMEKQVATILGHYFEKNAAEKMRHNYPRLNRFLAYANIQIDDEDDRQRFISLMLICATMLGEAELCEHYQSLLMGWSNDEESDTQAYMKLALFVYTRNPRFRDAAKAYRKTHPDCPAILGTFINKVREAKTKKPVT